MMLIKEYILGVEKGVKSSESERIEYSEPL